MRSRLAVTAAVATVLTACTSTVPTSTTVRPPTTAPTTTVAVTTTLAVRDDPAWIERIDPVTLEADPEYEPLPAAGWFDWALSPGERWLAIVAYDRGAGLGGELRLIDLAAWQQHRTGLVRTPDAILVDDAGTLTWLERVDLFRLPAGSASVEQVATLPGEFLSRSMHQFSGGIAMFGLDRDDSGLASGTTMVVTVAESGAVEEIVLPEVTMGITSFVEHEGIGPVSEDVEPAIVWDGDRALIVHADQPAVTAVDLDAGVVETHTIEAAASAFERFLDRIIPPARAKLVAGDRAAAALSPDGTTLYVARSRSEVFQDDEGGWHNTDTPLGLEAIDTRAWVSFARLDLPVGTVLASEDGTELLAVGVTTTWVEGEEWKTTTSPIYILEAANPEVRFEVAVAEYPWLQFAAYVGFAYVTTWDDTTTVRVLDLGSGDFIAQREALNLTMIPPVSVLGVTGS